MNNKDNRTEHGQASRTQTGLVSSHSKQKFNSSNDTSTAPNPVDIDTTR